MSLVWQFPDRTEGGIVKRGIFIRSYRCIGKSTYLIKLLNVLIYFLYAVFVQISDDLAYCVAGLMNVGG